VSAQNDNGIELNDADLDQFEVNPSASDNGSYGFEENLTFEQPSEEKEEEEINQADKTVEHNKEFIADLAEENANSFPSNDGTSRAVQDPENFIIVQDSLDDDVEMIEESNDKSDDTFAQSDDIKAFDQHATDLDAENISEDELPEPTKPKVQDAEEVSDEELPGPKMAELPEDTENVSDDELPASQANKKEKRKLQDYDPSDPTDENDTPEAKKKKDEGKYKLSRSSKTFITN
jgi:hypothetical protein